jgi:hydrogenase/urease accessory protein HupE
MRARWIAAFLLFVLTAGAAQADIFRPAYLELRELATDRYAVLWKVPAQGTDRRLALSVEMPPGTETVSEPRLTIVPGAHVERWEIRHPGGLTGKTIRIEGRAVGVTEVIARLERQDGSSQVSRLSLDEPEFLIEAPKGMAAVAWSYFVIGVEHILGGIDHLLFVLALLLIVKNMRRLIATVTAFTVAHSITLVAATLGWVHVPGPPVEAIIALSIMFVAAEFIHARRGHPGLTERAPWVVAFSFGLLHGFGFAGALSEVGLPDNAIPLALFTFNVGVEAGQLVFVGAIVALRWIAARSSLHAGDWLAPATAYGIGSVAAFWTIERIASFWS